MERTTDIWLIIGCICVLCFVFVKGIDLRRRVIYGKGLPDIRTLNYKYGKVYTKQKQKAWRRIHSQIVYAAKHGRKHVQIWPDDYIDIPYEEFKGELESRGYVLENKSEKWYKEKLSIDVSWEEDSANIPICNELKENGVTSDQIRTFWDAVKKAHDEEDK